MYVINSELSEVGVETSRLIDIHNRFVDNDLVHSFGLSVGLRMEGS